MNPIIEPTKFSTWKRLLRRTITVYKATNILRKTDTLNSQNEAQTYLIKILRKNTFRKTINRMQTGQQLEPTLNSIHFWIEMEFCEPKEG